MHVSAFHHLNHFNHWAVLVSALTLWVLGAVWYSPALFAKPWMAALGIVPSGPQEGACRGHGLFFPRGFIGRVCPASLHFMVRRRDRWDWRVHRLSLLARVHRSDPVSPGHL
jgi:hypothetical protein